MRTPEGVHVIPIEDLVPNCMHGAVKALDDLQTKLLGMSATQKRSSENLQELRLIIKDLLNEIKDANFNLNYLHIACVEAFANKLKQCGLGPYKNILDKAILPVYEYIRVRERQEG